MDTPEKFGVSDAMKWLLLVLLLEGMVGRAWAQVYAAPGMPVHLSRRPEPLKPKALPRPEVAPVAVRFWKLKDSAYVKAATPFYRYVSQHMKWPVTTLQAGIEGRIYVRVILTPVGTVAQSGNNATGVE